MANSELYHFRQADKKLDKRRTLATIIPLQQTFSHWVSQTSVAYLIKTDFTNTPFYK